MKEIIATSVSYNLAQNSIEQVADLLDTLEKQPLQFAPWPEFAAMSKVSFTIAHDESNIFLKYFVEEKYIRAENILPNSPVYEDSCVEFFISFDEGANYYNFEFNCIGTALVGYGPAKENRQLLDTNLIDNLKTKSTINSESGKGAKWELTIIIPLSTFVNNIISELKNLSCRANFYKCGDLLPEPHFISWSNIKAETPNFHLPEFFGRLVFE